MADLSRRAFLGASAAAAGAVAIGVPLATAAVAAAPTTASPATPDATPLAPSTASGPFMVYVADARRGDVSILMGTSEVTHHDPDLVARLARAASSDD
jgi:hypothetical protein